MSNQRFSPEFKDEAVRQIVDRGYSVPEVSERLGVSAHSLYKWVKAVKPDKTDEQASALIEARSEVMRLRAQLKRTEEERDILKKAAESSIDHCNTSASLSAGELKSSVFRGLRFSLSAIVFSSA